MRSAMVHLLRRARTPGGCAVLLALLLLDWSVLGMCFGHDTSAASAFRRWVMREPPRRRSEYVWSIFLVRDGGGGYRFIDQQQSADELASLSQNAPERVVSVAYYRGVWHQGLWAPWVLRDLNELTILELTRNEPPAPAEAAASREAFAGWLRAKGKGDLAALVEAGDFNRRGLVWWGPLHDLVGVVAVLVLASCVPRTPGWIRALSVQGRLRRNRCPACGYDLCATGEIRGVKRCPECGRVWTMPRGGAGPG